MGGNLEICAVVSWWVGFLHSVGLQVWRSFGVWVVSNIWALGAGGEAG